jgi:phosphate transport system protein
MKISEHTSHTFDAELNSVCEKVMTMAELVQNQLAVSVNLLGSIDLVAIDRVLDMGHVVNAMEVEIDELCTSILVRRQPTANDLRLVTTIIKTINDLERIGDEAESIARVSRLIIQKNPQSLPSYAQISSVAEIAMEMLESAVAAFEAWDADLAQTIVHKESLIDQESGAILRSLVGYSMEDGHELSTAMHAALIARSIERIANHSKHISEYVLYMIKGREVRNYSTI